MLWHCAKLKLRIPAQVYFTGNLLNIQVDCAFDHSMEIKDSTPSSSRLTPVIWGGVAVALAENLPGLSLLDWICCGTIWSGALLAVYLRWRQNPQRGVQFREAVSLGMLAALLGAVLNLAIDYSFKKPLTDVLRFFGENTSALAEKLQEYFPADIFVRMPGLLHIIFIAMSLFVHATIGAIGGMIGVTIFPPVRDGNHEKLRGELP
jgi:hypothetical protein